MTAVNAEQPQVRSGSLPTNTPRTIQRPAQPAVQAEGGDAAQPAAEGVKQRRKYNRRKPAQLNDAGLSREELAAWGEIALEARAKGVSVERFMTELEKSVGLKLQVWGKLKPAAVEAEQAEAAPEVEA